MGNTTHHIQIVAGIKTELQNMDETISKFKSKLNEGISKVDMTKGLGKDLSKLFSKFSDDFSKINSLTPKDLLDIGDSKEFQRTGESIIRTIRDIQRIAEGLGTKELIDAKKLFPNAFDSRVGDLHKELTNLGNSFGELAQKEAELVKVNNAITNLRENMGALKQTSENLPGLQQAAKDTEAILNQANSEISNIRDNLSKQATININSEKIKEAKEEIAKASQQIKELEEKGIKSGKGGKGIYDGLGITDWKKKKKTATTQAEKDQADNVITLLSRYNELNNTVRQYNQLLIDGAKLQKILAEDPTLSKDKNMKQVASILGDRDSVVAALEKQEQAASDAQQAMDNLNKAENAPKILSEMESDLTKSTQKAAELNAAIKALKASSDFETIKTKLSELGINNITEGTLKSTSGLSDLKKQLEGLDTKAYEKLKQVLKELNITLPASSDSLSKLREGFTQTNNEVKKFNDNLSEVESLKSRVAYFFGLTNSIQLLKRTVQSALNTVKELDAVMTETAVVTDFTVGDMWEKLPEYTDQASALGASIKDLYSATTLYYQQGLNSEQAMSVGVETMKMARIANMDAANATKAMTAALRGFNMEINETSAARINDVYSELAAITAADTNQIATAMGKTASIADSANMEFETTAALLAQIIETTQEAPETAGTAMKTIIARFTEVKKLFDEGMLSGEDAEGEAIEINKIDAALRKVGISLTDFLKGQKGIDDIFLELASKWDTLDLATQRYIATTAAGSRQQSRFIAMMSNYDRTMELVTAANNSAGASQEQFDKTLDSMKAKLQKLQNAWNEFTMGLANNEILKGSIDVLTGLLETINKLTEALSGGSGLGKSIINFMTVIGALKGGKALLASGFGQIGAWMGIEKKQQPPSQKELNAWQRAQKYSQEDMAAGKQSGFHGFMSGVFGTREKIAMPDRGFNDSYLRQLAKEQRAEARYQQRQAGMYLGMSTDKENIENIDVNEKFAQNAMDAAGTANSAAKAYDNLAAKIKAAKEITPELKAEMDALGITEEQITQYANIQTIGFQQMGAAALLAGGALGLLANAFDEIGNNDAAEVCQKLSATLTGMGGILMMLPMLFGGTTLALEGTTLGIKTAAGAFKSFGMSVWAALGWVAAAVAVIWLLVKAFQAIHAASPEGKLEAATEAANDAAEAAENAAQAYEHLASALDSISGKSAALENLAVGTTEWKNAVQELNGEVLDLVEQYPELAQFIKTENGVLSFSNQRNAQGKTVEDILNEYQNSSILAQSAKAAANIQKQYAQSLVDYQKTIGEIFAFEEVEVQKGEWKKTSTYSMPGQTGLTWVPETDSEGNVITETTTQKTFLGKKLTDEIAQAIVTGMVDYESGEDEENITINLEGEIYSFTAEDFGELKEYGNTLIAAEAATQAYAQAILANAAAISDIPEQTREDMSDFWAPKQVEGLTFKNKDTILKDGISDEELDKYAKNAGYTRVGRNLYKGEALSTNKIDWDEESVATALAGIQTSKDISELMLKQRANLGAMSSNNLAVFKAISGQNLEDLTISQLGEINTEKALEMVGNLGYKKDNFVLPADYAKDFGYEDIMASTITEDEAEGIKAAYRTLNEGVTAEEAQTWLQNQIDTNSYISAAYAWMADVIRLQEEAEINKGKITEKINTIAGGGKDSGWLESNLAQASYSTIKGLENQTSQMAPEAAKTYLQAFADSIANNKELSQDTQQALSSYLSNIDWSNMSQAINAMDYMQQMGLSSSVIKEFWNVATDGANTYMSSMSQVLALTEKFQGKVKQVDEIEEALADGKATNEQMQQLINAGIDVSNFELTADGWKATKEQIEEATRKLREYNVEQARAAAERQAEEIREMKSQARSSGFFFDEEGNLGASERVIKNSKGAIQKTDSGEIISGTVTKENMDWVSGLLDLSKNDEETDDDFVAKLQAALNDFISGLNNAEAIQDMANKAAALAEAAVYTTDENVQRGGSAESVRMSMQQEAKDLGLDSEEVTKYAEAVQNAKDLTSQTAAQIAIDYARMAQGMEEITSKWDEWKEKISIDNDMEKAVAFEEMATSANKMLGTIDVLDAEFVSLKENMDLIKQAAKGDADAFNKLQKAAVQKGLDKLKKDLPKNAKNFEKVNKALDQTTKLAEDLSNIEVDVGETFSVDPKSIDVNSISGQLTQLYNNAYAAALEGGASVAEAQSAANAAIEAAGYEAPEMEVQEVTVTGSAPDTMIPNITAHDAGNLGPQYEVNYTTAEGEETSQTVSQFVPKGSGGFTKKSETVNAKGKGGGGGGGGGGKWENSIDKLYNVQENIDRTIREREQIERRYQRLIDRRLATAQELQRVSQDEIESLKEQAKYQQQMVEGRQQMLQDEMEENAELKKYATVNVETGQITIDWELINSVTDEEEGSAIEDYLSKLEELRDSMHEAQDALEDINDAVWEIEERGREEYLEWEERIKEAYVEVRQKEIDTLEEINESINDTNDKLLDSIQQSIDKMRQDRENEKTEEDLQEKQRRLAYLEQDTSNANAMEILELREEIEEGQEDYTDTLIDQKISELQEQNDKAAEQREKQITLLQNQLDWEIESGRIWQVVEALMQDGLDPQGGLVRGSMLEKILREGEQWTGLSDIGQMNWLLDLETMIAESMNWRMTKGQLENLHEKKTDQEIEFINSKGEKLTGTVDEKGQVWTGKDTYYKDVYQWIDGTYHTTESAATKYEAPKAKPSKKSSSSKNNNKGTSGGTNTNNSPSYVIKEVEDTQKMKDIESFIAENTKEEGKTSVEKVIEAAPDNINTSIGDGSPAAVVGGFLGEWLSNLMTKKYKTGGLADFTGPAWLDGTKSRPELVLNQRDTQNFIQLKDILSSIMSRNFSNTSTATENNGDITYDIDINVETMGSDYDVEQVASKVKSMINEDARYRNNNAISLKR